MQFILADVPMICVENPVGFMNSAYRKADQIIHPYYFAEDENDTENYHEKRTCLWLKGLPPLMPTELLADYQPFINGGGGRLERPNYKGKKFAEGSVGRSKTFPGIAKAMADQWG